MAVQSEIQIVLSNGDKAGETLKELRKQAASLNKEISNLKPGTDEFVKKSGDLQKVSGKMGDIQKQIKGTTEASNGLKESFMQFIPFAGSLQKIGANLGFVSKGVGGLTSSLGMLRSALVSTGIGAIVVVLGLLINYLTSTQEGIDKLTAVTRPLQRILDNLKVVLAELGGKLFKMLGDAIKNPKQAIMDLGKAIKDNLIARFEALALFGPALAKIFKGEFADGFKDLGNAAIQATTGVKNGIDKIVDAAKAVKDSVSDAIDEGTRLDQLQKQIERAEIGQITRTKQLALTIAQQKAIIEDETKSYDVRRQAAQKALTAQQQLLNSELALLDKRIEKFKLEHSNAQLSRDQEKELAEMMAKRMEIQAQVTEQGIEFNKKIVELNKKEAEEGLAIVKNIQDLRIEAMKEGQDKEIAQINLDTERKIEALTGSAEQITEQRKLLEEIQLSQLAEIRQKYAAQAAEDEKKNSADSVANKKKETDEKIAEDQRYAEAMSQINSEALSAQQDIQGAFIDLLSTDEKERQKHAGVIKGLQVGSVGASLAAEVQAIWEYANKNPANALFPGASMAIATVKTIAAVVRAGTAIRKIGNTKFSLGGLIKGPSHAQGGSIVEAEGDEIILTKGVYRNPSLRRAASMLNVLGGGRKFAAGGPVNPINAFTSATSAGAASVIDMSPLTQKMDELIFSNSQFASSNSERIDRIRVINVVTDTEDGIKTVNKIRDEADT